MAHVLIGFAEALPAPEVFFSLRDAGHEISVFTRTGAKPPLVRHLPVVEVHPLPAPETDAGAASAALSAIMTRAGAPDLVLPLDDAGLWLTESAGIQPDRIAGASGEQASLALDKIQQIAAAEAAGFAVPKTTIIRSPSDLEGTIPLPAIVKPALAVNLVGGRILKPEVRYLSDQDAMNSFAAHMPLDAAPRMVQQLIAGQGEGIFGFAGNAGVSHWSGHRRLRMMNPHGSGSSACTARVPEPDLLAAAETFVMTAGWRGPFMIELLRDADGTAWFMELNGRMWGSMALARRQCLEYPAWAVARALDPAFSPPRVALGDQSCEARHLGRDLLHLLFVLRGPMADFYRAGWPRLGPTLAAVLRPQKRRHTYNSDRRFPAFVWRDTLHTFRSGLRRSR